MTEELLETGEAQFIFVKLANGENIICTTYYDVEDIQKLKYLPIIDPIQIFSFKIPQNGAFIEKYIMQTWAPFSSDTSTTIAMNNVVFVGRLKEYFIEKYIEYITDPNSQQMVEEGDANDTIESEEDDTTIEEVIEDYINKEENRKKWYH